MKISNIVTFILDVYCYLVLVDHLSITSYMSSGTKAFVMVLKDFFAKGTRKKSVVHVLYNLYVNNAWLFLSKASFTFCECYRQ